MKNSILLLPLLIIFASVTETSAKHFNKTKLYTDTVKIPHIIDGNIAEWVNIPFTADKETEIAMAMDNDKEQLYVALKITNQRTQLRLMKFGMNLFIDLKGKHREGTTIEFPIKSSSADFSQANGSQRDANAAPPDPEQIKQQLGVRLIFMKVSGFEGQENEKTLGLSNENGANIAFAWDNAKVMYIEYAVPVNSLGTIANLTGKKISIGLRLNAPDFSAQGQRTGTTTEIVKAPAGSGPRVSTSRAPSLIDPTGPSGNTPRNSIQEIYIWNKYDMKF